MAASVAQGQKTPAPPPTPARRTAARPMRGTLHDPRRVQPTTHGPDVARLWHWAMLAVLLPTLAVTVVRAARQWPTAATEARSIVTDVVARPGEAIARPIGAIAKPLVDVPGDQSHGSITIQSTPSAEVWIDGKDVGATPLTDVAISIGPHEIRFHNPDYQDQVHDVVATRAQPIDLAVTLAER